MESQNCSASGFLTTVKPSVSESGRWRPGRADRKFPARHLSSWQRHRHCSLSSALDPRRQDPREVAGGPELRYGEHRGCGARRRVLRCWSRSGGAGLLDCSADCAGRDAGAARGRCARALFCLVESGFPVFPVRGKQILRVRSPSRCFCCCCC